MEPLDLEIQFYNSGGKIMAQTVEAIYENGALRLLGPLQGLAEKERVTITIESKKEIHPHPLAGCIGIMPDEDAQELRQIIAEEFEKVDPREWS